MQQWVTYFLQQKWVLILLLVVNFFGTIYGFYWYRDQLADTPVYYWPFVPDSPTASLFFVFVLFLMLINKRMPLIEAFAAVTLVKYGLWAVGMNIGGIIVSGVYQVEHLMLIVSHFAMAVEALLFMRFYTFRPFHLLLIALWTLHNDVIDYVLGMLPRYSVLEAYYPMIGYLTFWLSVIILVWFYVTVAKKNAQVL